MKNLKEIPHFKDEVQERAFWAEHDSSEYVDWEQSSSTLFPDLKQKTKLVSLRLPESTIAKLKLLAHKKDISYQSLVKVFLADKIRSELK
ncbi:MAG: hypothetical protein A2Y14_02695 [Verrucomicrobia bacterium GWF2_51_19]|nr:MAG: hypothetical protein A2Y14_02695 [Verrucomicrobia bacterium GWF2_51_19]HCJ12250.1 hypothetical protein [Opitutae bacterium]